MEKRSLNCNIILAAELWPQLDDRMNINGLSMHITRLSDCFLENARHSLVKNMLVFFGCNIST